MGDANVKLQRLTEHGAASKAALVEAAAAAFHDALVQCNPLTRGRFVLMYHFVVEDRTLRCVVEVQEHHSTGRAAAEVEV